MLIASLNSPLRYANELYCFEDIEHCNQFKSTSKNNQRHNRLIRNALYKISFNIAMIDNIKAAALQM